jgi:excisionase family DNA binding protein
MNYNTLVVEPAWDFSRSSAREGVPTAILNLPISSLSAEAAHLYLWIPDCLAAEGIELMRGWGFAFKTMLVWLKHQAASSEFFNNAHELILFGVKGDLPPIKNDVRTWFMADSPQNSLKPDEFYHLAEHVSPGPRIILFGKEKRDGWEQWGSGTDHIKCGSEKAGRSNQTALIAGDSKKSEVLSGWLTCETLASRINVSVPTLRRWSQNGTVPCHKLGRLVRYNFKEVEEALLKRGDSLVGK